MGNGTDITNPIDYPRLHDLIVVQDQKSPGLAKVSGFKRSFGWEVKQGKGAKGSTVTLNEYPPAEGTVTLYFWLPEHFEQWREFRDIWNYDPTKKPIAAVDIYHPALADLDINRVVCKSISAVEHQGQGMYSVTIELIEYNPPPKKPAVSTPSFSSSQHKPLKKERTDMDWLRDLEQQRDEGNPQPRTGGFLDRLFGDARDPSK